MNAQFKQSLVIDGQKFMINQNGTPVVHAVPAKIAKHPHFKHFVKAGLIVSTDEPEERPALETADERNHRLAAKIANGMGKPTSIQKAESDPVEEPPAMETDDEESFMDEESDFDADDEDMELEEEDDAIEPEEEEEVEEKAPKKKVTKAKTKKKTRKR